MGGPEYKFYCQSGPGQELQRVFVWLVARSSCLTHRRAEAWVPSAICTYLVHCCLKFMLRLHLRDIFSMISGIVYDGACPILLTFRRPGFWAHF